MTLADAHQNGLLAIVIAFVLIIWLAGVAHVTKKVPKNKHTGGNGKQLTGENNKL